MDLPRKLAYVRLEDVLPAIDNGGRVHDLPGIKAAITQYGFNDPLSADERTGRLLGGHGRVSALVSLRAEGAPCPDGIVVDDDGGWLVPVMRGFASSSDEHATGQLLAFNKLPQNARYTDYGLAGLLEQVATAAPGLLDSTGYDGDEIDALLKAVTPEHLNDPDPDLPDLPSTGDSDFDKDLADSDEGSTVAEKNVCCPACGHLFPARV